MREPTYQVIDIDTNEVVIEYDSYAEAEEYARTVYGQGLAIRKVWKY